MVTVLGTAKPIRTEQAQFFSLIHPVLRKPAVTLRAGMSAPIRAVNTIALSLITQVIITREVTTRVDTAAAILGEAVLEEIAEEAMVVAVVGAAIDRRCAHSRVACCFG